eukprot:TRINITY_DN2405_c0_g1_i2.p1 TRINITY_DN2405_c0_g1~~TRINITY_DN2405_c0_g1_i2.p1  ORF type:complete len:300 (-),score=31.23 TRINITY_DN2405_c0_g1_i2:134-1033(-)
MMHRMCFLTVWFVTCAGAVVTECEFDECVGVALLQNSAPRLISTNLKAQTMVTANFDFIIGAGLPKTATVSLFTALEILGRHASHGGTTLYLHAFDPAWDAVLHGDNVPAIKKFLREGYDATAGDSPWCFMYEDLMRMKPNYKVISSVHPGGPDAWVDSSDTWNSFHVGGFYPPAPPPGTNDSTTPPGFAGRKITDYPPERLNEHFYASKLDCFINETHNESWGDRCKQGYLAHYDKVRRAVPKDRLLEFNASDGWAPLCSFLNLPVPDMPFPDVNDRTNGNPGLGSLQPVAASAQGSI